MKPDRSEHSAITPLIFILRFETVNRILFFKKGCFDMFEVSSICQVQG